MAWTAPSTFVAGAILTAAQLNTNVRDNSLAGGPIYATEAARDAAIPTPFEGQRAYITGSTIAAASVGGGVPTGIQTIHNGSSTPSYAANWVCVTPVGAFNAASGTRTGAYSATLAGTPGTNPTVTISTGTSALVMIGHYGNTSSAGTEASMSVAVSGAGVVAASNNYRTVTALAGYVNTSTTFIYSGLTAGTNTFELQYASAATGDYGLRRLIVQGIA
jgi:hypothetical protein